MQNDVAADDVLLQRLSDPLEGEKKRFRVMAMIANQTVRINEEVRRFLEEKISKKGVMQLDRSNPEVEYIFMTRSEGFGQFVLRLTKHANYEKTLERGELYPELA